MYHEARTDKKLASLSDAEHRVWFDLLCFASESDEHRGIITGYDVDLLAVEVAHGDADLLNATLAHLAKLRIIAVDATTITFLNFKKRQYSKPSDEPEQVKERVTKHRNAKRNAHIKESNATVTPMKRAETRVTRPETEADTDTESESTKVTNVTFAANAAPVPVLTIQQRAWAVLRDELGYQPSSVNKVEKGAWNGAIRTLLLAGETPESLPELVASYRERWPEVDCTPMALVKNQSLIRSPPPKRGNGHARTLDPGYMDEKAAADFLAAGQKQLDELRAQGAFGGRHGR